MKVNETDFLEKTYLLIIYKKEKMEKRKKFFFKKEDNAIKELLDIKKMHNIVGGLESDYKKTTYAESTGVEKPKLPPKIK